MLSPVTTICPGVLEVIDTGAFTVTLYVCALEHPETDKVYEITTEPSLTPVTTPPTTVATAVFDEDHVPVAVASDNVRVFGIHNSFDAPVIGATVGYAFTVNEVALTAVPPEVVTEIVPVVAVLGKIAEI